MEKIDIKLIQELRTRTGLGMMDCKKALEEAGGSIEEAITILRKKGAAVAAKRADKETGEGLVHAYIHPGSRIGVLIELNCETDFVARTDDMKNLAQDLCLHITAMKPLYLKPEDVAPEFLEHERTIIKEQLKNSGKPEKMIDQIADAKVNKLYEDICLLNQSFVKNDQQTVQQVVEEIMAKTGEKVKIKRFARYELGT